MKTLLLTDIPPSSNLTAGIVTAQMCRFVPQGELAIFLRSESTSSARFLFGSRRDSNADGSQNPTSSIDAITSYFRSI